jgi:hypothetical protein
MPRYICTEGGHGPYFRKPGDLWCPEDGTLLAPYLEAPSQSDPSTSHADSALVTVDVELRRCDGCGRTSSKVSDSCPSCCRPEKQSQANQKLWVDVIGVGSHALSKGDSLVIGRDTDCAIVISGSEYPYVSRRHLLIELTPTGVVLTDRSTNGTWRMVKGSEPIKLEQAARTPAVFSSSELCRLGMGGYNDDDKHAPCH